DGLSAITGQRPAFFRAPAGLRNIFLEPALAALGLRLASWSARGFDTRTGDAQLVARRLVRALQPGAILLLHDGHAARSAGGVPAHRHARDLARPLDRFPAARPAGVRVAVGVRERASGSLRFARAALPLWPVDGVDVRGRPGHLPLLADDDAAAGNRLVTPSG